MPVVCCRVLFIYSWYFYLIFPQQQNWRFSDVVKPNACPNKYATFLPSWLSSLAHTVVHTGSHYVYAMLFLALILFHFFYCFRFSFRRRARATLRRGCSTKLFHVGRRKFPLSMILLYTFFSFLFRWAWPFCSSSIGFVLALREIQFPTHTANYVSAWRVNNRDSIEISCNLFACTCIEKPCTTEGERPTKM